MKKIKVTRSKEEVGSANLSGSESPLAQTERKLVSHGKRFGFKIIVNQIGAISKVTFHELLREKILWSSMAFGILAVILSVVVSRLSYTDNARLALDFGMTSIAIVGAIIAIMMGSSLVAKELQHRTHFIVLTKPVFRWQFIVGRWLGLIEVITLNSAIMFLIMLSIFWQFDGKFTFDLFQCLVLILVEFGVLAAVASIFSTFTTTTLSAIITIGIWISGHAMENLKIMARKVDQEWLQYVLAGVTETLPDLTRFDIKMSVSHMIPVSFSMVSASFVYGIAYMFFALLVSCIIFSNKEL